MRSLARLRLALSFCLVCSAFFGCSHEVLPEGVVATVNGKPIMLRQVEAEHDISSMSWFSVRAPSVEQLKSQYGDSLYLLIVQELIAQSLDRSGLSVTDAELTAAEAQIRADYPEGEFEKALIEDYIDPDSWRGMLRYSLNQEKFMNLVLKPGIVIRAEEAERYYNAHLKEFNMPARTHFLLITGPNREPVEKARASIAAGKSPWEAMALIPGISVRDTKLEPERMPAAWSAALKGLAPNKLSPVTAVENEYQCLLLLEHIPAAQASLGRAYPLIERILVENKTAVAFVDWLESELKKTTIKVSPHLVLRPDEKAALQEQQRNIAEMQDEEPTPDFAPPDADGENGI